MWRLLWREVAQEDGRMHPAHTISAWTASYREQNRATWTMGHPGAYKTGALTKETSEVQSIIRWLPAKRHCHAVGCQERILSNHFVFHTDMHNNTDTFPKYYEEMVTLKNMAFSLLTLVDASLTASLMRHGYRYNYQLKIRLYMVIFKAETTN